MNYTRSRTSSRVSTSSKNPERDYDKRRITLSTIQSETSRQTSVSFGNLQSQWEILMRKFSQDCKGTDHYCTKGLSQGEKLMRMLSKEAQRTTHLRSDGEPMTCESRPLKKFSTGSTYEGTWDALGMCGYGTYTFPNGVVYRGEFEDSVFHGDGEMRYPDGTMMRGKWNYGALIDRTVVFDDEVHFSESNWKYCKEPDRRFSREYKEGIQPGGRSFMTNDKTFRVLRDGTYDTGDGIFDPKTGAVNNYNDNTRVVRFPPNDMKMWIEENCRKAPDTPVGSQPDLYKPWLDANLTATVPPRPECMSDEDADPNDIYSNENYSNMSSQMFRSRPSISSFVKRSKLKFERSHPRLDSFRPEPCETQISRPEHPLDPLQGQPESEIRKQ